MRRQQQTCRATTPCRDCLTLTTAQCVSSTVSFALTDAVVCRRFLQRKFDEAGPAAVSLVLPEVLANLVELMMDPFGNYLVQKMLDRCNEEQRLEVLCNCCAACLTISIML